MNKLDIPFDSSSPRNIKFDAENLIKYKKRTLLPASAQNVSIVMQNSRGESTERCLVNFNDLLTQIWEFRRIEFPFLKAIDFYNDTFFNIYQTRTVIGELESLADLISDLGLLSDIAETRRFLMKIKPGELIRFIGD